MDELLQCLETKIRALINRHNNLQYDHSKLNQSKLSSEREKEQLFLHQQKAVVQIEGLVEKLKSTGKMT